MVRNRSTTTKPPLDEYENVTHMSITGLQKDRHLGFIGLGLMGSRLARRPHTVGWNLRGWNRRRRNKQEPGLARISSLAGDKYHFRGSLFPLPPRTLIKYGVGEPGMNTKRGERHLYNETAKGNKRKGKI